MKMVNEIKKNGIVYFKCEECSMLYASEKIAKKCENFCRKNKSCNIEIIKHAIKL